VWNTSLEDTLVELRQSDEPEWTPRLIESLRAIPNYYLQYFYYTQRKLAEMVRRANADRPEDGASLALPAARPRPPAPRRRRAWSALSVSPTPSR
jgi:hypothetical protein